MTMENLIKLYENMGISQAVYQYGESALQILVERFAEIDKRRFGVIKDITDKGYYG